MINLPQKKAALYVENVWIRFGRLSEIIYFYKTDSLKSQNPFLPDIYSNKIKFNVISACCVIYSAIAIKVKIKILSVVESYISI